MFEDSVKTDILAHAAQEHPKEACGFVVDGKYQRATNIHENPLEGFRIAPKEYILANKRELQAIVHSHPEGQLSPSYDDMVAQIKTAVPWGIAPHGGGVFWFGDGVPRLPYEGRPFRFGVTDCITALRDWYFQELGIKLPDCPRTSRWWMEKPNRLVEKLQERGLHTVTDALQRGDVLIMSIGRATSSHCAVYLGDDKIYHHAGKRLSSIELIHRWSDYITVHMRHPA